MSKPSIQIESHSDPENRGAYTYRVWQDGEIVATFFTLDEAQEFCDEAEQK
jgi:hypothetical protein